MDDVAQPVAVIVSIADDHLDDLAEVVANLRRAGLTIADTLDPVGIVTGTIAAGSLPALDAVPGVAEVERQHVHRLPPPDSDIQ